MSRGLMWFWFVWSLVFGAVATVVFAQTHAHLQLAAALFHLIFCAYYAAQLWGKS